jgi:phosphoglucan,water dikinase
MAGAGLFDSVLNVKLADRAQVRRAIIDVWLSLFSKRAIISRKQNQILSCRAQMAILVQRMVDSEVSFIIHSVNPITEDPSQVYIELAIGQGETLASAN